jgi:Flp pilus assembly protein CpaB
VVLILATALTVNGLATRADRALRRWGDTVPVAVATQPLAPGDVVSASAAVVRHWPRAVVPPGALHSVPVGRTVVTAIYTGEVIADGRVAPDGLHGVAALLPPGTRALTVPTDGPTVAVALGDRVDLLATFDPSAAGDGDPTFPVAEAATVVAVSDQSVTVAVAADDAPRLAFALAQGTVAIAVRGASPDVSGSSTPGR